MKNVFKKTFKIIIICFALILSSCEKELYEQSIIKNKSSKTEMLRGKEAEKVALRLKKILGSQNSLSSNEFARTISLNIGNISYDEILKIIDTYGKENYTLKIELPEETDLKFANLVLQEKDAYTTIKLIEYNMTEQFAQEFKQHKDITRFKGTIKFTPIFSDNPCPEPEVIVHVLDIPSNNASNTGNSGYIVPGSGGVSPATPGINIYFFLTLVTIQIPSYSGSGDNTGIGNIICPPSYHYDPAVRDCVPDGIVNKIQIHNPTVQPIESEEPCPPETEIGILIPLEECSRDFLNELDDEQQAWMYQQQSNNAPIYNDILYYVAGDENGCSAEKNYIGKEMITALMDDGEVDFSKNIIYGINKPCQKQIVKDIIDVCSPFTELIQQTFNSTDNVNIKFYNGNLPNGNAYTNPNYIGNTQNFTIRIKFDDTFLNTGTNLSIVAVTLHELVHAYLMNLYLKGTLVATNSEYNTLQNAFIAFYNNQVQDTFDPLDNEIHNAMDDFISNMANSIYNYALSKNISVTADYCEKLAWGTMSGTDLFIQSLTPEQQIENNNIFAYEQDNILPQAKGTPCN